MVGLSRVWLTVGLVFALTAALLMGLPSQAGAVAGYGDVPEDSWYTDAVQWSVDNGIADIAGFCFAPETPVSRGETAMWIYNMENQPDAGEPHPFTDVTDASQNDAISWMSNTGITTGTSDTTFAPDETLKRAQVAAFLYRLEGEPSAPPHNFSDVVAAWQQDSVSWMSHTGITTGTTSATFAPEDTLTRAQLITFLYRYRGEPEVAVNASTPNCTPITDTPTHSFKTVDAGGSHNCGIRSDDTAVCWGDNQYGQAAAPAGGFKTVSAGGSLFGFGSRVFKRVFGGHSCGIRSDDTAVCWGIDSWGQATAPTGGFKTVDAGNSHSCGIRSDNTVVCWGNNEDGQADAPTGAFKTVDAGWRHSCGIRSDNTVVCWGINEFGQTTAPAGGFKSVSVGSKHSCGLRSNDTITCWGSNSVGQATAPTGAFKTVSSGMNNFSCGIRSNDTIVCWGGSQGSKAGQSDEWPHHRHANT